MTMNDVVGLVGIGLDKKGALHLGLFAASSRYNTHFLLDMIS